jgi:hypothetical protein
MYSIAGSILSGSIVVYFDNYCTRGTIPTAICESNGDALSEATFQMLSLLYKDLCHYSICVQWKYFRSEGNAKNVVYTASDSSI